VWAQIEIPLGLKILLAVILCIGAGFAADRQSQIAFCDSLGFALDPNTGHLVECYAHPEQADDTNLIIPGELPNGQETPEETAIALST
jgi:hypothetical protein